MKKKKTTNKELIRRRKKLIYRNNFVVILSGIFILILISGFFGIGFMIESYKEYFKNPTSILGYITIIIPLFIGLFFFILGIWVTYDLFKKEWLRA